MTNRGTCRLGGLAVVLPLVLVACTSDPRDAFLTFVEAMEQGDAEMAFRSLSRATRERLEKESARLTELTRGAVERKPIELLVAGRFRIKRARTNIRRLRETQDEVVLRVDLDPAGEAEIALRREDGQWRVHWPPPGEVSAPTGSPAPAKSAVAAPPVPAPGAPPASRR